MKKPWSKLKKELTKLWVDELPLDIHQAVYRMQSQRGSSDLPRYFITLQKDIIFDFPKDFTEDKINHDSWMKDKKLKDLYPYDGLVSHLSETIREYIDTPVDDLLTKEFPNDFGLIDLFRSADRRIGKDKLKNWSKAIPENSPAHLILKHRFQL